MVNTIHSLTEPWHSETLRGDMTMCTITYGRGFVLAACVVGLLAGHAVAGPRKRARKETTSPTKQVRGSLLKILSDLEEMRRTNASNPDPRSRKQVAVRIERAILRVRGTLLAHALNMVKDPRERLQKLKQHARGQRFLADQAVALVWLFRSAERRVEAAAALWKQLLDRGQTKRLLKAVGGKTEQDALKSKVNAR